MRVDAFRPEDLEDIELQDAQVYLAPHLGELAELSVCGDAWTVRDGRILGCGGLVMTSLGAHLWGVVAKDAPMLRLHRIVSRGLDTYRMRITATADFPAGCRWLQLLGFEFVETLRGVGETGADHHVYARPA